MKKLKLVGILAAVVLIGSVISIPLINNHTAYKVEKALCEIPLPEETELIESLSQAGKLTGNGNGMQYLGALLVKSNLSLKDLKKYYAANTPRKWYCDVERQKGQSLRVSEHVDLRFKHQVKGKDYYVVYAWGDYDGIYSELDLRGH